MTAALWKTDLFSVGNNYNYCVGNEKMNKWLLRLSVLCSYSQKA